MLFVFVHRRFAPIVLALAFALMVRTPLAASSTQPLRIDRIFAREPLTGRVPAAIAWSPDGRRFLYTLPGGEGGPLDTHIFDVRSHSDRIFVRAAALGHGSRPAPEFVWSPDSRSLTYLDAGDLWLVKADGTRRRRLARDADDPQWSPDSTRIAYVHANDLYAVTIRSGHVDRFSFDGTAATPNGEPDWAYSEELEMRHAYRWSPDGRQIAYLHVDERPIAPFPIVDYVRGGRSVDEQRYPLAGGRNSIVTLRVASAGTAGRTLYSTRRFDDYLASVGWTPDGEIAAQLLDRSQRRLRDVSFTSGIRPVALVTERDRKWVDLHPAPVWLRDRRRYVFLSDRDGQTALYLGDRRTQRATRLTYGYAVSELAGVDERRHVAYVAAAFPTRRDATLLAVPLIPGAPHALASGAGTHTFFLAPNARDFVRSDSAFDVPPRFWIGSTASARLSPLTRSADLQGEGFGQASLFEIPSKFGPLDAWMLRPPNFDPAKRYPAIVYVYGGPAAPTTADDWDGTLALYHRALAQHGFIVVSVDGPGSRIDSAAAVRRLFGSLGPASLAGQLAGAAYLRSLPYIDARRIGIWGWSFGGYETAYALTHAPGVFKAGIAVAPVTDWRMYDTIYTERYMGLPQQHAAAYTRSSVIAAASALQGRLLLAHGTSDDNVHLANTLAFVNACVLAGRHVELTLYPGKTHSIAGISQRRHLFTQMLDFWQQRL